MKNIVKSDGACGDNYHRVTVMATFDELMTCFGLPSYTSKNIDDKVQVEWDLVMSDDEDDSYYEEISLYDWKEYREYPDDEMIEWHIGGRDYETDQDAQTLIEKMLEEIRSVG